MPERPWRVAVLDSGIGPLPQSARVVGARRFADEGDQVLELPPIEDPIGHGTAVASIIASTGRPVELVIAQVLNERARCTAATFAAAIVWALGQRAELLHCSLGLPHDRAVLRTAIAAATGAGVLVVAAAPARGATTYPAAYRGVIRATGDARCDGEQISFLASCPSTSDRPREHETQPLHVQGCTPPPKGEAVPFSEALLRPPGRSPDSAFHTTAAADFGACPVHRDPSGKVSRGASMGAAHLSRYIVTHMAAGLAAGQVYESLIRRVAFHGPERHHPHASQR
ncbi:MAG: S8 family serine peptidase [Steroidobacteraceae bacterium]